MKINELFYSLQGEGRLAGVPSVFLRLSGCPLRCRWCDTAYARNTEPDKEIQTDTLIETLSGYPARYIVITGGEPMIHPDLPELLDLLHEADFHITIETAGIIFLPKLKCDLMSVSPKLSNSRPPDPPEAASHERIRFNLPVLKQLTNEYPYQLKFVVDTPADFDEIIDTVKQIDHVKPQDVFLMPQATTRQEYIDKATWLVNFCLKAGFSFGPRLHVMLWPGQRGK